MAKAIRSESPDDFLKRSGLSGRDKCITPDDPAPTIDRNKIQALRQIKDDLESPDCKECE